MSVKDKTKNQILEEMVGTAEPGSPVHEQQKMGIMIRCVEDFEKSMNNNAASNEKLATKVFYLNIILTVATVIGTVLAIIKML